MSRYLAQETPWILQKGQPVTNYSFTCFLGEVCEVYVYIYKLYVYIYICYMCMYIYICIRLTDKSMYRLVISSHPKKKESGS